MALICDTGPLYASMDRADQDHETCVRLLSESEEQLLIPAPVMVELGWLASRRLGWQPMDALLRDIEEGRVHVVEMTRADYVRIRQISSQYADLPLGFVDAAVLAVLERLKENKLATLDHRHFSVLRPRHTTYLHILPGGV